MEVDAGFAKTGLKSVSKLHSSTFLDGKVVIDGGKLARVDLNMPRDTMEILEASADFYTWQVAEDGRRVYLPLESDNQQEVFVGCSSEGNDLFGVELCGVAKYHYVPDNELVIVGLFLNLDKIENGFYWWCIWTISLVLVGLMLFSRFSSLRISIY